MDQLYQAQLTRLESLNPEVLVPDGLAAHIESTDNQHEVFVNTVGLEYDDSTWTKVRKEQLVEYLARGRNDLCHCNSGTKYKRCHAKTELPTLVTNILERN